MKTEVKYWLDTWMFITVGAFAIAGLMLLVSVVMFDYTFEAPSKEPTPVVVKENQLIKKTAYIECMRRIQDIKALPEWYKAANECSQFAKEQSVI